MSETRNAAISGTYVLHQTTAAIGTTPKRVKPVCGQSTRSSYMSVITPEQAEAYKQSGSRLCTKCHG